MELPESTRQYKGQKNEKNPKNVAETTEAEESSTDSDDDGSSYVRAARKFQETTRITNGSLKQQAPRPKEMTKKDFPQLQSSLKAMVQCVDTRKVLGTTRARNTARESKTSPHIDVTKDYNPANVGIKVRRLRQTGPSTLCSVSYTEQRLIYKKTYLAKKKRDE